MSIQRNFTTNYYSNAGPLQPSITIVDQPKQRGLRFRYKCEGRSAGSIPGDKSSSDRKTYPSIKINNYDGPSAIVVVSCVTKDPPYLPHPHNLVGQDCDDGVCTVKVKNPHVEISFPNIGIQCCKRQDIEENLKKREKIRVDPFGTGYPSSSGNIDLNAVRLCFQVFLPDANRKFTRIVDPVFSNTIIDKKSVHDLVICRLSTHSGSVGGGDEVFLLCEKINKDDIKVYFYQEQPDGEGWEAEGEFTHNDVHRQYAIVFKTPPYKDLHIQESTTVFIQLRRPSDDESGDPKPFQYIPQDRDDYGIEEKKRKRMLTSSLVTSSDHVIQNQIPRMVMEEYNKDDNDNEVNDLTNGRSFVKSQLKKKIENKIPDHSTFSLNPQSLVHTSLEDAQHINKALRFQHNIGSNAVLVQPPNIIHFYNNHQQQQYISNNNEEEVDIKNIIGTTTQLNNNHNIIINNKISNTNEMLNYNYNNIYTASSNNIYNNSDNNTYNSDNNSSRLEVGAHEIICTPTTTTTTEVEVMTGGGGNGGVVGGIGGVVSDHCSVDSGVVSSNGDAIGGNRL